jgi:hypothetical protein
MMSGGDVDEEPSLSSRNTLGNGKTANSKSQTKFCQNWVKMAEEYGGGG